MQVLGHWPKGLFVYVSGLKILICVSIKQQSTTWHQLLGSLLHKRHSKCLIPEGHHPAIAAQTNVVL